MQYNARCTNANSGMRSLAYLRDSKGITIDLQILDWRNLPRTSCIASDSLRLSTNSVPASVTPLWNTQCGSDGHGMFYYNLNEMLSHCRLTVEEKYSRQGNELSTVPGCPRYCNNQHHERA